MEKKRETWKVWIDDTIANIAMGVSDCIEDCTDDIVSRYMAYPFQINDYLESIGQERVFVDK